MQRSFLFINVSHEDLILIPRPFVRGITCGWGSAFISQDRQRVRNFIFAFKEKAKLLGVGLEWQLQRSLSHTEEGSLGNFFAHHNFIQMQFIKNN